MKRRTRRTLPAILTALALLAGCVFVTVAVIQRLTGHQPWLTCRTIATTVRNLRLTDLTTGVLAGAVTLIGLMLLLAALLPGKRTVLPLAGTPLSGITRTGYRSTLRAAVAAVDGITAASVSVGVRQVTVRAKTKRGRTDGLADTVRAAVEARLDHLALVRRPAVSVKVRTPREST